MPTKPNVTGSSPVWRIPETPVATGVSSFRGWVRSERWLHLRTVREHPGGGGGWRTPKGGGAGQTVSGAAHGPVRHPALGPPIRRIARYALPVVLIGLGILILAEADTLSLIG